MKNLLAIFIMLFLMSCTPSLSDVTKIEGGAGQGAGGSEAVTIADLLQIPPAPEDRLQKDFVFETGTVVPLGPVSYIIAFVQQKLNTAVQQIFQELNSGGAIDTLVGLSFLLWVALYCASLLLGLIKVSSFDIVMTIVKVTIVAMLATNYNEFKIIVQDTVEGAGKELTNIVSQAFSNGRSDFSFADDVVSVILSERMLKFLYALFSPEIGAGWLYGVIMVMFIWFFITALLKAIYLFIIAMIMQGVLFALAPLFMPMIMFRRTKPFFDGWVKQLANFTLMPVILFAFLGFFYSLITYFVGQLGSTPAGQVPVPIAYGTAFKMPGNMMEMFKVIFGTPGDKVAGADAQIPVDITPIIILATITYVMRQMVDWAIALSGHLTQAFTTFTPGSSAKQLTRQLGDIKNKFLTSERDIRVNIGT